MELDTEIDLFCSPGRLSGALGLGELGSGGMGGGGEVGVWPHSALWPSFFPESDSEGFYFSG